MWIGNVYGLPLVFSFETGGISPSMTLPILDHLTPLLSLKIMCNSICKGRLNSILWISCPRHLLIFGGFPLRLIGFVVTLMEPPKRKVWLLVVVEWSVTCMGTGRYIGSANAYIAELWGAYEGLKLVRMKSYTHRWRALGALESTSNGFFCYSVG